MDSCSRGLSVTGASNALTDLALQVAFRVDASLRMGTGHVMRCLTLADALKSKGATCQFICRAHEGHLIDLIRGKGHVAHALHVVNKSPDHMLSQSILDSGGAGLSHAPWLGSTQIEDANACAPILATQHPDWLVVDHYALDVNWERALSTHYRRLLVIDDLADRKHVCDLLLDQTFGRDPADYASLVPEDCRLLCGSQFALLRPEFAALREHSLKRRIQPSLKELLISMGGVDLDNCTEAVLRILGDPYLAIHCNVTVVMGSFSPWLKNIQNLAHIMPRRTTVLVGVANMASLMAESDLAIGAAGSTSWERCCLGLPSILVGIAENQRLISAKLNASGAALAVDRDLIDANLKSVLERCSLPAVLSELSYKSAKLTDGQGTNRLVELIYGFEKNNGIG